MPISGVAFLQKDYKLYYPRCRSPYEGRASDDEPASI